MDASDRNTAQKTVTDLQVWYLLYIAWYALSRLRNKELSRYNLTVEQGAILDILRLNNGWATAKDVETITMRKHNSISVLINRMVKNGLLYKEKAPDEKSHRIIQTEKSKDLYSSIRVDSIVRGFSTLSPEDKENLSRVLHIIHKKARDLIGVYYVPPFIKPPERVIVESGEGSSADAKQSDHDLWSILDGACFAVYRLRQMELEQYGITVEQLLILRAVDQSEGWMTTRGLERRTLRNHNSLSAIIGRMVTNGLLSKDKKQGEKSYSIFLTPHGKQIVEKLASESVVMVLDGLSTEEKQRLHSSLRAIYYRSRDLLRNHREKSPPVSGDN
jgi:DNA-binding MarR family transcriptional regulator